GSSAVCGMNDISGIFRKLERMGEQGNLSDGMDLHAQACEAFERLEKFLSEVDIKSINP
ncbi:MAG: hypothetical protein JWM68_1588, partial [Verrucomicrobiales bacterium]|nr:hypothetical protein [Verrucomicrobiales bacterium]